MSCCYRSISGLFLKLRKIIGMRKEIFSWAGFANQHYNVQVLKTNIRCHRCGGRIDEAGFWGYRKVPAAWMDDSSETSDPEAALIHHYQFFHTSCDDDFL